MYKYALGLKFIQKNICTLGRVDVLDPPLRSFGFTTKTDDPLLTVNNLISLDSIYGNTLQILGMTSSKRDFEYTSNVALNFV